MNQEEDKKIITETIGNTTAYKKVDSSQPSAPQEEGPGSGSETSTKQNNGIESVLGQGKFEDTYQAQDYYQDKINQSNEGQVIDAKHNAEADAASTKSANFIAKNAAQANENYVRNEYQANQTVDKSGWTGGYALDTQRQLDYLKNSIAADIYSQQELQKLGYKSNLEQAKMAAEQEKNQLAFQRYQAAQAEAVQKAQLTGYYIDPHISDMLTQFNAAQADLKSGRNTEKANKVIEYVQNYFNHMNDSKKEELGFEQKTPGVISIKGIETLASIQAKAEAEYNRVMAEKENIIIKNSIEESKQAGDLIPYFTKDGTLAGYGNTIPTGGPEKEHLQKYFSEHEGSLEQTAKGILSNMSTQYAAQLEKNPDLSFEDFMKNNYNGAKISTLLNTYAEGKTSITIDGVTVSKEGDTWKVSGQGTNSNSNALTQEEKVNANNAINKYTGNNLVDELKKPENGEVTWQNYKDKLNSSQQEQYKTAFTEAGSTSTNGRLTTGDTQTFHFPSSWKFVNNDSPVQFMAAGQTKYKVDYSDIEKAVGDKDRANSFKKNGQMVLYDGKLFAWSNTKESFLRVNTHTTARAEDIMAHLKGTYFDANIKSQ